MRTPVACIVFFGILKSKIEELRKIWYDALNSVILWRGNQVLINQISERRNRDEKEQELFDSLVYSMLYTGEETGTTEYIYEKLSDFYEVEADFATQKIMAIMEPLILVVIGAIIGGVVAAVLIPMYQIAI